MSIGASEILDGVVLAGCQFSKPMRMLFVCPASRAWTWSCGEATARSRAKCA